MDELKQRILQDGIIIDNRILKIDNFLNQQIDTTLINHVFLYEGRIVYGVYR